jgi:(E)-4-hydroxy-3-methyl-but-2-enyl pyrophosphate reductase
MKVKRATTMGFCGGVRRAIKIVAAEASKREEPIYSLGQTVHNPQVVHQLAGQGVFEVKALEEVPGGIVSITAHGAAPWVPQQVKDRGLELIDATCPLVTDVHTAVASLKAEGFKVVVYGDPGHNEVKGIVGWTDGEAVVVSPDMDPSEWTPPFPVKTNLKMGIVSQTTQDVQSFSHFVSTVSARFVGRIRELRVLNTICQPTVLRQEAALRLADDVDVIVVIGGRRSANTRRLWELAGATGKPSYWIESLEELQAEWFKPEHVVGVTAGASTPDWLIDQVVERIEAL